VPVSIHGWRRGDLINQGVVSASVALRVMVAEPLWGTATVLPGGDRRVVAGNPACRRDLHAEIKAVTTSTGLTVMVAVCRRPR